MEEKKPLTSEYYATEAVRFVKSLISELGYTYARDHSGILMLMDTNRCRRIEGYKVVSEHNGVRVEFDIRKDGSFKVEIGGEPESIGCEDLADIINTVEYQIYNTKWQKLYKQLEELKRPSREEILNELRPKYITRDLEALEEKLKD